MAKSKLRELITRKAGEAADTAYVAAEATNAVLARLGLNPAFREQQRESAAMMKRIDQEEAWARTAFTSTDTEELRSLIETEGLEERVVVYAAGNPFAPTELLEEWSESPKVGLRAEVAENPATPIHILVNLSTDGSLFVRAAVASNPSTSSEVLDRLLDDDCSDNTPGLDEVERDLNRGHLNPRRKVAGNPSTSKGTREALAADENWNIRIAVAEVTTDSRLLSRMANDETESYVRRAIAGNEHTISRVLRNFSTETNDDELLAVVARNPNTPSDVLLALAEYANTMRFTHSEIRKAVADNPSTPTETAELLKQKIEEFDPYKRNPHARPCSRGRTAAAQRKGRMETLAAWNAQKTQQAQGDV
ncbi:hypothetical protein [Citricoccus nitrophenolicus]|uniref:hypothetical protein n=1 Tax=Citricoccus nitrophenolicus TaxID=863575 RepID=UPI0031EFC8B9